MYFFNNEYLNLIINVTLYVAFAIGIGLALVELFTDL